MNELIFPDLLQNSPVGGGRGGANDDTNWPSTDNVG